MGWPRINLRWRCEAKGTSSKGEADSSNAPLREGAARRSVEAAVMVVRAEGCIIPALCDVTQLRLR